MNANLNEEELDEYVCVSHDDEALHLAYIDEPVQAITISRSSLLKLIAYVFKRDLVDVD